MRGSALGFTRMVLVCLAAVLLAGCALQSISASQGKASQLLPELVNGRIYGQVFTSLGNNLYRIDLSTATYDRANSGEVSFHLRANPQSKTDLAVVKLPASVIRNDRPTSIVFPPIPDSAGKQFFFYVESPQSEAGNAVSVYYNVKDDYPSGSAYLDGKAAAGDLVFTAYSSENYFLAGIVRTFMDRAGRDLSFFIPYALLVLGLACGLVFASVKRKSTA